MFKDELQENGYTVVSLFSEEDLTILQDIYNKYHLEHKKGEFFASMFHPDASLKLKVSRAIAHVLERTSENIIKDYRCLFANFLVKAPKSSHFVGIHQDWSYIDESNQASYNIWGSLEATTEENGGLFVLPKSHKFDNPHRGTPFNDDLYNLNQEAIQERAKLIPTKKGEAIIYDSRLIHYSLPNRSLNARIAFAGIMIPEDSSSHHFYQKGESLYKYEADESFFCKLIPDQEPKATFSEEIREWYRPNSLDLSNFILSLDKDGK